MLAQQPTQVSDRTARAERWAARNDRIGLGLASMDKLTFEASSIEDITYALYAWASVCVHNPVAFLGLSTIPNEPLQHHKKVVHHFSYKKALLLDPILAEAAKNKELDKIESYGCFTENYPGIPNFTDGSAIKMYPIMPFSYKVNAVTGENDSMNGRLAIDGSGEPGVPDEEKSTHTADQEFVNLAKAAIMAYFKLMKLLDKFFCNSFDVNGAFLHADYDSPQKIYVQFPKDFPRESFAGKLLLMLKAVYGVKRSNAIFNVIIDGLMSEAGFIALGMDRAIYVCFGPDGKPRSICFIHVDDGQMLSCYPEDWTRLVSVLERRFGPLKVKIPSTGHIGINTVFYADGSFSTNQKGYIIKSLQIVDPENKLVAVPTPSLKNLFVNDEDSPAIDIKWYQHLIGILIYTLHTRFDIKKEVLFLAKRSSHPTMHDLTKVTRVFAYLKGTNEYGPVYYSTEGPTLVSYVDASHNAHILTSRAHDANFTCIGHSGGPCSTRSKMQTECISTSSTESEYVALSYAAKTVIRCRKFLTEMGFPQTSPTIIYSDCKSAVTMTQTMDVNKKSQHIENKFNYTKDLQIQGHIIVVHINREYQRADFMGGRELSPTEFINQRAIFMAGADPEKSSKRRKPTTVLEEGVVSEITPDLMKDS